MKLISKLSKIEKKHLLFRKEFITEDLMREHPPIIHNTNKRVVFGIACLEGCEHKGKIVVSKWSKITLPEILGIIKPRPDYIMEENAFQYGKFRFADDETMEWYVNFADRNLFGYYGAKLFAQDEIQSAEHPAMGAIREALLSMEKKDSKFGPYTRDVYGDPTPFLVQGLERRVSIATGANKEEGRPKGLYGRNFGYASEQAVRNATQKIDPPTITNLIAMEAPKYGRGEYTLEKLYEVLHTAYTGFMAVKTESVRIYGEKTKIIIHTGNWGGGVYGGNKIVMALLQMLAALIVKVDYLVYHTYDHSSSQQYQRAKRFYEKELFGKKPMQTIDEALIQVRKKGFEWGTSDGN